MILTEVISNIIKICTFFSYFGIVVSCVIVELHFLQKRGSKKKLIPLGMLLIGIVLMMCFDVTTAVSTESIKKLDVIENEELVGTQIVLTDSDFSLIQIGQFIIEDSQNPQFVDVILKNGEVTLDADYSVYEDAIAKSLHKYNVDIEEYEGVSMKYGDLIDIKEHMDVKQDSLVLSIIANGAIFLLPGLSASIVYCVYAIKNRRSKNLKKMKLEEL